MKIDFEPLTPERLPLAEEFKRRTAVANLGSDERFFEWFKRGRTYADFAGELLAADPAAIAFLTVDRVPVGDVELRAAAKEDGGFVSNFYLEAEWRGRGLGRMLDEYAMAFFRRHGQTFARLRTNPENMAARGFYSHLEWKEDGPCPKTGMLFFRKRIPA
jgi:ribosomal protein S18 acetylase RimI-like enzyme